MSQPRIFHKFGESQTKSFANHATNNPLATTPGWRGTSGTPFGPTSYGPTSIGLNSLNSFDTGFVPTGNHSILVAVKGVGNGQTNVCGCGQGAGFTFPHGPELIFGPALVNLYGATASLVGQGIFGWSILGYSWSASAIELLLSGRNPIFQTAVPAITNISANTRSICLGGGRYDWSPDTSPDDFAGVMLWDTALTRVQLAEQREAFRDALVARGVDID